MKLTAVAVLAATAGFGGSGRATAAGSGVKILSESEEIRAGREASAEFESEVVLSTDAALIAKVRRIGNRLAAVSDRPDLPYQFKVIDSPTVNAVAFPGGFIYVYQGLIDIMPSDDALAAILGHEITHAADRHWARGTELSWLVSLATLGLAKTPVATAGAQVGGIALGFGYSRHVEAEADRVGFGYLVKAGYDPNGAVQAWEAMIHFAPSDKERIALLRTHPMDDVRLATLRRLAEAASIGRPKPIPIPESPAPIASPNGPESARWFPLALGCRWVYRSTAPDGSVRRSEWAVTGIDPEHPGTVRLAIRLPGGVDLRPWARVSARGLDLRMAPEPAVWLAEAPTPAPVAPMETVTVPAGTFTAARVEKTIDGGATRVTLWIAPGTGVVKRSYEHGGLTEELESVEIPGPTY